MFKSLVYPVPVLLSIPEHAPSPAHAPPDYAGSVAFT